MDPKFVIIYNSGTLAITLDPQMELLHRYPFFLSFRETLTSHLTKNLKKKKYIYSLGDSCRHKMRVFTTNISRSWPVTFFKVSLR